MFTSILLLAIISPIILVNSVCPYLLFGTPAADNTTVPELDVYNDALDDLDLREVFDDLYDLLRDSQDCWPADAFNGDASYGPLMIRLAWHCAGTFRETDGIGGCSGGRQRFWPEASWADNTNLDKARALLGPIKEKYGDALSWGDLFIFAGTAAILDGDGPATEICAGRIDDPNGNKSEPLGPGPQAPNCTDGVCPEPLGTDQIGLIYVNPVGYLGNPVPSISAERIREIFGRMGMNDSETVALIGGGHAFGKAHGACPDGPGLSPNDAPYDPWSGNCGNGKGLNTSTSGLEGQWTGDPLSWDNEYFTQLIEDGANYSLITGDGGNYQWENINNGYMMLTTDLALIYDDDYYDIVASFAEDIEVLNIAFAGAWEKLVTNGGVWAGNSFCVDADELGPRTTSTETPLFPGSTEGLPEAANNHYCITWAIVLMLILGFVN